MDVGVVQFHQVLHRVDDGLRLLRAGGGIKICQRLVVHQLPQHREIGAALRNVEFIRRFQLPSHDRTLSANSPRTVSSPILSIASLTNAPISSPRASAMSIPRERM